MDLGNNMKLKAENDALTSACGADRNVTNKMTPQLKALEDMTKEEFDAKMATGLAQAKSGEGMPASEFFDSLRDILARYQEARGTDCGSSE